MRKRLFIYLLISAILLASCGGKSTEETPLPTSTPVKTVTNPQPAPEPDNGGTLTLSMRHPLTLNPLLNEDETIDSILSLIFEKLFVMDEQNRPNPNPALITNHVLSNDAKTITLTLRNDIYWQNGERITAADVAFSIEYLRSAASNDAIYKDCVSNILSTSVSGDNIRINLIQPYSRMEYMLCFPIIPQSYYKGAAANNNKQMKPLGNGPYAFESYTAIRELVLKASEWSLRGPAYIENIRVIIMDSNENDINAFATAVIDTLSADMAAWNRLRSVDGIRQAEYVSQYFDYVGFNFDNPLLNDRNIRVAVAHCLPYSQIAQTVYRNAAVLSPTPINPTSWLADSSVTHSAYDTAAAAELFAEYDNLSLRILVNNESSERVRVAELLQENLLKAGVPAEIISAPWEQYSEFLNKGDFDIFLGCYKLSVLPDLTFLLHSSNADDQYQNKTLVARGNNLFHYRDDNMDRFLADAYNARESEEAIYAYSQLQNYIAYDMPLIGLVFRKSALLTRNTVYGELSPRMSDVFQNIEKWYINTK